MVRVNQISFVFILVIGIVVTSCNNKENTENVLQKSFITDCGCDSLWSKPSAQDFVALLEETTLSNHPIWKGYNLGDAAFVLYAGQANDSTYCLGLWKNGKSIAYKCAEDRPKMLTPLYSYYLNYASTIKIDSTLFGTYTKAPEFSSWMISNQVETAVYMPTDFPEFPFKLSAKTKVQLAIHEAFHIEVMLRSWYSSGAFWPKWDKQPDRSAVQNCYSENESAQSLIEKEQELLALLIEALLDHKESEVNVLGNQFLETREARYNSLTGKQIKLDDDNYGDCKTAEALMEIEEGLADYASWVKMFDIGVVSRTDLFRRYRAKQKDVFYLTGCMLMHASVLLNNGNDLDIMSKMVNSKSVEEGNLLNIFKNQLALYRTK